MEFTVFERRKEKVFLTFFFTEKFIMSLPVRLRPGLRVTSSSRCLYYSVSYRKVMSNLASLLEFFSHVLLCFCTISKRLRLQCHIIKRSIRDIIALITTMGVWLHNRALGVFVLLLFSVLKKVIAAE